MSKNLLRRHDLTSLKFRYISLWDVLKTNLLRGRFARNRQSVAIGPLLPDSTGGGANYRHIYSPLVRGFNRGSTQWNARYFASSDALENAEIIMVMKHLESFSLDRLDALKGQGKTLVFELMDNPAGCVESYLSSEEKLKRFDIVMAWSPVQVDDLRRLCLPHDYIGPCIANRRRRERWNSRRPLTFIWQGFPQNAAATMSLLNPVLSRLAAEHEFRMIYHGSDGARSKRIEYRPISGPEWESTLLEADVGIVVKDLSDPIQNRKPYNKLLSYMAAGLAVVCTPTRADRDLVEDSATALFAFTSEDWYRALKRLLTDRQLALRLAKSGTDHVWSNYTPEATAKRYAKLFERLRKVHP